MFCRSATKLGINIFGIAPKLDLILDNENLAKIYHTLQNRLYIELNIDIYWSSEQNELKVNFDISELTLFNIAKEEVEELNFIITSLFDTSLANSTSLAGCNNLISGLEEKNLIIIYSNVF